MTTEIPAASESYLCRLRTARAVKPADARNAKKGGRQQKNAEILEA